MNLSIIKIDKKKYYRSFAYRIVANIETSYGAELKNKVALIIGGLLSHSPSDSLSHYILAGISSTLTNTAINNFCIDNTCTRNTNSV